MLIVPENCSIILGLNETFVQHDSLWFALEGLTGKFHWIRNNMQKRRETNINVYYLILNIYVYIYIYIIM